MADRNTAIAKKTLPGLLPGTGWLNKTLHGLTAGILFAMMMLVFIDVFLRYWFLAPLPGAFEVTEMMMGALVFAGLPIATAGEHHITIGLMDRLLGERAANIRLIILRAVGALAFAGLTVVLWLEAMNFYSWGDYTAHLKLPIAPLVFFMTAMSALCTLIQGALMIHYFRHPEDLGEPHYEDMGGE